MPSSSSFTVAVERIPGSSGIHAELRCARCSAPVVPPPGIYVLRMTIGDDGKSLRGTLSAGVDGPVWAFASGSELARIVLALGHVHDPSAVEAAG